MTERYENKSVKRNINCVYDVESDDDDSISIVSSNESDGRPAFERDMGNSSEAKSTNAPNGRQIVANIPTIPRIPDKSEKWNIKGRLWCFTTNNYIYDKTIGKDWEAIIKTYAELNPKSYIKYYYEVAPTTGMPHLQGFCGNKNEILKKTMDDIFKWTKRCDGTTGENLSYIAKLDREHPNEIAVEYNVKYKPKDNEVNGHIGGQMEKERWQKIHALANIGDLESIRRDHYKTYIQYENALSKDIKANKLKMHMVKVQESITKKYKDEVFDAWWMIKIINMLNGPFEPRKIHYVYDPIGTSKKTFFAQYLEYKYGMDKVDYLEAGEKRDLSLTIDETKSIFVFDIARSDGKKFDMAIVEKLKDNRMHCPKYESKMKFFIDPYVIVFSNHKPRTESLTVNRLVWYDTTKDEIEGSKTPDELRSNPYESPYSS